MLEIIESLPPAVVLFRVVVVSLDDGGGGLAPLLR